MNTFPISEIFCSVQMESNILSFGLPSIFIRFAGCNLSCYECDTSYASTNIVDLKRFSRKQIFGILKKLMGSFPEVHLITFSGGEPGLFQKHMISIIRKFPNFVFDIETNGTIIPDRFLLKHVNMWNISPKLKNMCDSANRINQSALRIFNSLPNSIFKFVISNENDMEEIYKLRLKKEKIILMPMGFDAISINEKTIKIVEMCKKYGYRMTPRLQIMLYGGKIRGV